MTSPDLAHIVLTGGPCSGKTTAMRYLVDHLSGRGWRPLVVPEAATMLLTGGLGDLGHLAVHDRPRYLTAQTGLIRLQAALRDQFTTLARNLAAGNPHAKTVLLYDRAELDNRAYLSAEEFPTVLDEALGLTTGQAADRYDAVIHLVTAADGAEAAYSTATNAARTETPAQAIALDRATQAGWLGHPHLTVIDNARTFDAKLARTLAAVLNILGEPEPVEVERKWLLAAAPPPRLLTAAVPVDIEQAYLPAQTTPGGITEHRIRARTHDGHTTYFRTTKTATGAPVDAWLLEAELVTAADEVTLPVGLPIAAEVTEDPAWRNATIARRAA